MSIEAGWYVAAGDPPGTHRYWNGAQWATDAQPIPPAAAPAEASAPAVATQPVAAAATTTSPKSPAPERWTPDAAIAEREAERAAAAAAGNDAGRPYDPFNPDVEEREAHRTTASVWQRYAASFIDGIVLRVVTTVVTLLLIDRTSGPSTETGVSILWLVAIFALTAAYDIGLQMAFFATPGKLIMKTEIVSDTGHHATTSQLAIRGIVKFAPMLAWLVVPPILGILLFVYAIANIGMIFLDPRRQSFPDKIAKTRVVNAEGLNQWNHQH